MTQRPQSIEETLARLEQHGVPSETRTEATTEALIARHPDLGRVAIADVTIDGPNGPIPARRYAAVSDTSPGSALVWLHGGAWVAGTQMSRFSSAFLCQVNVRALRERIEHHAVKRDARHVQNAFSVDSLTFSWFAHPGTALSCPLQAPWTAPRHAHQ